MQINLLHIDKPKETGTWHLHTVHTLKTVQLQHGSYSYLRLGINPKYKLLNIKYCGITKWVLYIIVKAFCWTNNPTITCLRVSLTFIYVHHFLHTRAWLLPCWQPILAVNVINRQEGSSFLVSKLPWPWSSSLYGGSRSIALVLSMV